MADARNRCSPLVFALLAGIAGCAHDSPHQKSDLSPTLARLNALTKEASAQPNLLATYEFYKRHLNDSPELRSVTVQVMAGLAATMGAYEQAESLYPNPIGEVRPSGPLLAPENYVAVDAADEIVALAHDRRIVMVNEAHHLAQTRLLTLELLPKLRRLGFTHFAAEAIDAHDEALASRGYPNDKTGSYVQEPIFGEIVRTALRLGFVVVPYESLRTDADPDRRENDQARHIVDRVFARSPNARLFVEAGYSHIHKRADQFFTEPLAQRLAQRTHYTPLCVDQTVMRAAAGKESGNYTHLIDVFHITAPTVLVARDTQLSWSTSPALFDVSVILPPPHDVDGRPDWLTLGGTRLPIHVTVPSTTRPYLVEARYAAENDDAVPADRELIDHAAAFPTLYLKPGDYRLRAVDAANTVLIQQSMHVD
jgi:hypothetical protein